MTEAEGLYPIQVQPSAEEGKAWYAVMARPASEDEANRHLKRLGFATFFPHVTEWAGLTKKRARLVKKAWLSGYLFVQASREDLHLVHDAVGVAIVLHAAGQEPFPIPDEIMETLFKRTDPLGCVYRPNAKPPEGFAGRPGDTVKGKEGSPLWGLVGEISKVCGDKIAVKMVMFASEREILTSPKTLEIVEKKAKAS